MSDPSGDASVSDTLLAQAADEESLLPTQSVQSPSAGAPGLRSWRRAADALERETGIDVTSQQRFPHELGGLSKKFVTKIVTVIGETSYTWEARQHRRNRAQRHEIEHKPELLPFAIFDKERIAAALSNPVKRISFWVGPLFFIGGLLFVVATASSFHVGYWEGEWAPWMSLAFVDVPFFVRTLCLVQIFTVGALAFSLGCYASFVEVVNVDVSDAWDDWAEGGREGPPPAVTYAAVPTTLDSQMLSFYGLIIQYAGAIIFLIGGAMEIVHTANPDLSPALVAWLRNLTYLIGGLCFALGAYLLAAEGSHSWWRGLLPPLRSEEVRSVNYWLEFLNWAGSALFFAGGAADWFLQELSLGEDMAVTAATWQAGSAMFMVQGALLYLEIVNPAW